MDIIKNPEEIEKKIMPYLADIIHKVNEEIADNAEVKS